MTSRLMELRGKAGFLARMAARPGQVRHARRWLRSLQPNYLVESRTPWITFDAMDYLRRHVPPRPRVFEYGSGGSTLFWLDLGATVTSIEHDPQWHALLSQRASGDPRLDYRLVTPDPLPPDEAARGRGDVADPHAYRSDDPPFHLHQFKRYVTQIDEFPDGTFDVVIVDGRARPACVMHAAPKVRPGGLLVLDNAERAYYTEQSAACVQGFGVIRFPGVSAASYLMSRTDVYRRPG